jgi:threonine aldolase
MLAAAIRDDNIHVPVSRLLCLENTHNRRGGAAIAPQRIREAAEVAHAAGLRVHCDGARLFNASTALGCSPAELVEQCDTVSVCLSKGLGAPVGSVIAGDADVIADARRWRKRLGGGMRQAGVIAAAGLYALKHNLSRLADDHAHARLISNAIRGIAGATVLEPSVPTNIVIVETRLPAAEVARRCAESGVLITTMGPHAVRCVTHLDVDAAQVQRAASTFAQVLDAQ